MDQASSTRVVRQLREQGFVFPFALRGGFGAWLQADGLVEEIKAGWFLAGLCPATRR
jgi:hypothetical protein